MRECMQDEFTSIYVLNLRGNARTSGEQRRKESGNVFGEGTRTPITITFLVKNPAKNGKATILYHDIGDYLTREQKLTMVKNYHSIEGMKWENIEPNDKNDWINQREDIFDTLIPLYPDKKFNQKSKSFFNLVSMGIATNRDAWDYNFSKLSLYNNIQKTVMVYNNQVEILRERRKENPNTAFEDVVTFDESQISWSSSLTSNLDRYNKAIFEPHRIKTAHYRPFVKSNLYFGDKFVHRRGQFEEIFRIEEGRLICVPGIGVTKDFTTIISDTYSDMELIGKSQCFPLYWYEENKNRQKTLFDEETGEKYIRRDGITDWILKEVRSRYHTSNITKEMIFYYVYGLLHSKDYRTRFAADLKKSLPRIPIVERVEDFMDFYKYGKKLADLHLNYEAVAPYPDVKVVGDRPLKGDDSDYEYYRVWDKMRFNSKSDKNTIIYNGNIRIENIPSKAYEYVVNGKSAIEWIVERYCVSQDKKSLIKNDANDWGKEHGKPRYILDLLLSVINVSVQTVDIVNALPKLNFE